MMPMGVSPWAECLTYPSHHRMGTLEFAGSWHIWLMRDDGKVLCVMFCWGMNEFGENPIDDLINDAFAWEREN